MQLKCLIELLLEKEYIEEVNDCVIKDKTILNVFECKFGFDEVYQKVRESKYHKDIIVTKTRHSKNRFVILNVKNLEEGLIHLGLGRETFGFRADHHNLGFLPNNILIKAINKTRFDIIEQNFECQIYFKLGDSYIRAKRMEFEKNKKNEVLDFLNQLP